jgi:hypothetical protein
VNYGAYALVVGAGAGLLVYVGFAGRRAEEAPLPHDADEASARPDKADNITRAAVGLSLILTLAAPAWDLLRRSPSEPAPIATEGSAANATADLTSALDSADRPTGEEVAYIRQHLRVYDLGARYFDSVLDGRVPGVRFKIKNNGNRTLNRVTVRVVFLDAQGNPIAEEEYNPVLVSQYSIGEDNSPLRPNYIWQQASDRFLTASNVPTEWHAGSARATITDIEFGPNE